MGLSFPFPEYGGSHLSTRLMGSTPRPTAAPIVTTPVPTTASPAGGNALDLYDDNGNGRITCAEARAHGIAPVERGHPAYEYMRDGDGVVCE